MQHLSSTNEDYVRALVKLSVDLRRPPRAVEVAQYMKLAKSTVTERLQRLSQEGLITYDRYGTIQITRQTKKKGRKLTRAHRIIEAFLHQTLERPIESVHEEAHRLEHGFSDESIEAIYRLLQRPTHDPHGQKIEE